MARTKDNETGIQDVESERVNIIELLLFGCPVMSDSLLPHGLQHARPLCPSPSPIVCPSSCPLHRWCHPAISSSDTLFFCPHSFPASGTFPMSQVFASDDQNTGVSASVSVLPMSIQGWFPLRLVWFDLFAVQRTLRSLLQHHRVKASILWRSAFFTVQLSQPYVKHWEDQCYSFDYTDLCWQRSLPFNTLSRVVIAFLPRSNHLLISWLQ